MARKIFQVGKPSDSRSRTAPSRGPASLRGQPAPPPPILARPTLSGEVREIPFSDIRFNDHTFQFRLELKNDDLKSSIEREGQQFPVVLRGARPPYQIVCGFRRVSALHELGRSRVKAIVVPDLSEDEAYRLSVVENQERASLGELDLANAVVKLRSQGKKEDEIAGVLGRSRRQVQRYFEVSRFPPEIKRAISSGKITMGHGLVLNRALVEGARIDVDHWVSKIQEKKLSVPALRRHLAEALGRHRTVHYFTRRGRGFRLASFEFDPGKVTPRERREMLAALKRALVLLRKTA